MSDKAGHPQHSAQRGGKGRVGDGRGLEDRAESLLPWTLECLFLLLLFPD